MTIPPVVSVLMPVYNARRYVARTVETVLAQTFGDFEFVIIDDGSTDGSSVILRQFAERDNRIRLVSRPNTGYVTALNEALDLARGELLARIDSDDWAAPRRFELQVERMLREPGLVALGTGATAMDDEDNVLGDYSPPLTHEEIDASHLRGGCAIHHPSVMMRPWAVKKVGGYRKHTMPCEDFDLWVRLAEVGRVANLPEPLLVKRLHAKSALSSHIENQPSLVKMILQEAWKRRGLPGEPTLPPRPMTSLADLYRQWGWMALKSGNVRTSRRCAIKALASGPWDGSSWRLAACALRGR